MPAPNARDAIVALLHESARRLDAGDLDGVAALFAAATFGAAGRRTPVRGAAAVRALLDGVRLYDGVPRTCHLISNVLIDVAPGGRTAAARCYVTVFQAAPGQPLVPVLAGRYHDRFAAADGVWRFTARVIHPDLRGDLSHHLRVAAPADPAPTEPSS